VVRTTGFVHMRCGKKMLHIIPDTENATLERDDNELPELFMNRICDWSSLVNTDLK